VTALLKPYVIVFALVAALSKRANVPVGIAAIAAFLLWALHDAVLWNSAIVSPTAASSSNGFASAILAHGFGALVVLSTVALRTSPLLAIALLAAPLGPMLARRSETGWCALFAFLFYLAMPLGYCGPGPQLTTGASLRYAAPAMALGFLVLIPWLFPIPAAATVVLVAGTLVQAAHNVALFFNDLPTLAAPGVALVAVAIVALARRLNSAWPVAAGVAAAIVASGLLAARQPVAYYADAMQYAGAHTGLYAWIARRQPAAVAGNGLALGTVNVLSPQSRTLDLSDAAPCENARSQKALLVAVAESGREPTFNASRLRDARACGTVLYDDGIAVVSSP